MRLLKRIGILLIELLGEAVLWAVLLGGMMTPGVGLLNGILGSLMAVPVIMGLHGYYISRVVAVIAWKSKAKWAYPALAATAFLAHGLFIATNSWSDFSAQAHSAAAPFLAGGSCIVFACAFAGDYSASKWLQAVHTHSQTKISTT